MDINDVARLAQLSRIAMTEDELKEILHDMQSILGYVEQIESVPVENSHTELGLLHNVLRDDATPHASGIYTDALMQEAPASENNFVKVAQILGADDASSL